MTTDIGKTLTIEVKALVLGFVRGTKVYTGGETRRFLSPNGRGHWAERAAAVATVRYEAYIATRLAKGWWVPTGAMPKVRLSVDAAFLGAALTDSDNMGWLKPVRDGIMDCLAPWESAARRDANVELGTVTLVSRRKEQWFRVEIEVIE